MAPRGFLNRSSKKSSFDWRVVVDKRSLRNIMNSLNNVNTVYVTAMNQIRPEFGAYMPYSGLLEIPIWPQHDKHLAPAIENNRDYILSNVNEKIIKYLTTRSLSGGVVTELEAKQKLMEIWEEVLNSKPRRDAQANAPVLYGFHRFTIRGYGDERSEADIRSQQKRLVAQRNQIRKQGGMFRG